MAIFHFTVKIIGRSKGRSVIAASAYLNGDVMKNEETGKVSYYTSKKEVVYSDLMMCENAPLEWTDVPNENVRRFVKSLRYKRASNKEECINKFKMSFRKQRLWNEVLKIEKSSNSQLARTIEFSLPKEWNRREQIEYTTDYIKRNFVSKGMCADWSIHDKGDNNPHVHLLLTMRPFEVNHTWGNKEMKEWDFLRDTDGTIIIDKDDPNWWQDKKDSSRCGIRIPVLDANGNQKVGARNRKQWKRTIVDATGWNHPRNCELWRSEWAKQCNKYLKDDEQIDHRSFERQGRMEIPTIHEGVDARKIEKKFIDGKSDVSSWKIEENNRIKKQNIILQKINRMFGKVSNLLKLWKESVDDIRRKQRSDSNVGINDKSYRGTAGIDDGYVSRDTRAGQGVIGDSGTSRILAEIKLRIATAVGDFTKYRGNVGTSGKAECKNSRFGNREQSDRRIVKSKSRMATIGREIEQREQFIAGAEQRIIESKQQLEKVKDVDERINKLKNRRATTGDTGLARADARRAGAEGFNDSRAATAAERIAKLKREAKQREQNREYTSIKERLGENRNTLNERERSDETSRSNNRKTSR